MSLGAHDREFRKWVVCPGCGPQAPKLHASGQVDHPPPDYDYRIGVCSACGGRGRLKSPRVPRPGRKKLERCGGKCTGGNPNGTCDCACRGRCHGAGRCLCSEAAASPRQGNPRGSRDVWALAAQLSSDVSKGKTQPAEARRRLAVLEAHGADDRLALRMLDAAREAIGRAEHVAQRVTAAGATRAVRMRSTRGEDYGVQELVVHRTPRPDARGRYQVTTFGREGAELVPTGHHYATEGATLAQASLEAMREYGGRFEVVEANPLAPGQPRPDRRVGDRLSGYRIPWTGEGWDLWLRALARASGAYVIKDRGSGEVLYVGESHTGSLYDTITRHFQRWGGRTRATRRTAGTTYDRDRVLVAVKLTRPSDAIAAQDELIARLKPRDNDTWGWAGRQRKIEFLWGVRTSKPKAEKMRNPRRRGMTKKRAGELASDAMRYGYSNRRDAGTGQPYVSVSCPLCREPVSAPAGSYGQKPTHYLRGAIVEHLLEEHAEHGAPAPAPVAPVAPAATPARYLYDAAGRAVAMPPEPSWRIGAEASMRADQGELTGVRWAPQDPDGTRVGFVGDYVSRYHPAPPSSWVLVSVMVTSPSGARRRAPTVSHYYPDAKFNARESAGMGSGPGGFPHQLKLAEAMLHVAPPEDRAEWLAIVQRFREADARAGGGRATNPRRRSRNPDPAPELWTCNYWLGGAGAPDCEQQRRGERPGVAPAGWMMRLAASGSGNRWTRAVCPACVAYGDTVRARHGLGPARLRPDGSRRPEVNPLTDAEFDRTMEGALATQARARTFPRDPRHPWTTTARDVRAYGEGVADGMVAAATESAPRGRTGFDADRPWWRDHPNAPSRFAIDFGRGDHDPESLRRPPRASNPATPPGWSMVPAPSGRKGWHHESGLAQIADTAGRPHASRYVVLVRQETRHGWDGRGWMESSGHSSLAAAFAAAERDLRALGGAPMRRNPRGDERRRDLERRAAQGDAAAAAALRAARERTRARALEAWPDVPRRDSPAAIDEHAVNELVLYAETSSEPLCRERERIERDMIKRYLRGQYDPARAMATWRSYSDAAAAAYTREHGTPGPHGRFGIFSAPVRRAAAEVFAERSAHRARVGELEEAAAEVQAELASKSPRRRRSPRADNPLLAVVNPPPPRHNPTLAIVNPRGRGDEARRVLERRIGSGDLSAVPELIAELHRHGQTDPALGDRLVAWRGTVVGTGGGLLSPGQTAEAVAVIEARPGRAGWSDPRAMVLIPARGPRGPGYAPARPGVEGVPAWVAVLEGAPRLLPKQPRARRGTNPAPVGSCPACGQRRSLGGQIDGEAVCLPCAGRYAAAPAIVGVSSGWDDRFEVKGYGRRQGSRLVLPVLARATTEREALEAARKLMDDGHGVSRVTEWRGGIETTRYTEASLERLDRRRARERGKSRSKNPPARGSDPKDRGRVGRVSLERAARAVGADRHAKVMRAGREFHAAAPQKVTVYRYDDGKPGVTRVPVMAVGRVPEVHYTKVGKRSNKHGKHWVHETPKGSMPLLTYDPATGTQQVIGGTMVTADWLRR